MRAREDHSLTKIILLLPGRQARPEIRSERRRMGAEPSVRDLRRLTVRRVRHRFGGGVGILDLGVAEVEIRLHVLPATIRVVFETDVVMMSCT